jgi:hypothetical protein
LEGGTPDKKPSKETLNHPDLIRLASGCDPYDNTPAAFVKAYENLGIDIVNMVPEENAHEPARPGEIIMTKGGRVQESHLGVYNGSSRIVYPYKTVEEFWGGDIDSLEYSDLDLPGAQYLMPCTQEAIECKMQLLGNVGIYYYQLYTTLFMWAVEALGWEIFLVAAALDPERFNTHFLEPVFAKTKRILTVLSNLDSPWIFCHDDIAMGTGSVFNPEWYHTYIFPRYEELWRIPHSKGKKVFFVADGKLDWCLDALRQTGIDGLMFDTPATNLEAVIDFWGDAFFIGGVNVKLLTRGTPEKVRRHVDDVVAMTKDHAGFALSCSGGLHGNIPLKNVEAYFDRRAEYGYNRVDWRYR